LVNVQKSTVVDRGDANKTNAEIGIKVIDILNFSLVLVNHWVCPGTVNMKNLFVTGKRTNTYFSSVFVF
jgi:hypothetical protein